MNIKEKKTEIILKYKLFSKLFISILIILSFGYYLKTIKAKYISIHDIYSKIKKKLNINLYKDLKKKIRIGIYAYCIKNGGRARLTSILINNFYKFKIFKLYLFTKIDKEKNEYKIPDNVQRTVVNNNLVKLTIKYKLDILIYQLNNIKEIKALNKLKNINTVFYQHSSLFYELYSNYSYFYNLYKEYQNSKYIVSIIRYENDYLFNKWGIKSILMNNFVTFDYEIIIQSDLSTKTILMFGRANNKFKRFNLGILSMEYIKENIKECKMTVISNLNGAFILQSLVNNLDLNDKIEFVGYSATPEINFKNASLHIFPSISESFGLVLCETKLYGIPNILVGLNYISASNGGTIIVYDDSPESIARESLKILKNNNYKGNLGKEARISMKKFNNNLLLKNWIRLILTIYKYHQHYEYLRSITAKINQNMGINIIKSQIILLKKRKLEYYYMNINDFLNYSQLKKFLIKNN
jgi:hypothetical protein